MFGNNFLPIFRGMWVKILLGYESMSDYYLSRLEALEKRLADRIAKQAIPRPDMIEAILSMNGGDKVSLGSAYSVPEDYATYSTSYLFKR